MAKKIAFSHGLNRASSMRGPYAPAVELNAASLGHVRRLLRQLLQELHLPDPAAADQWERALMPILLQATDDLDPDIRTGDEIDIRSFVKIKRIPGATPDDTVYLSGVVFTKNLALKAMPREISDAKVMLLSFPLEYSDDFDSGKHTTQHYMSLEPVIQHGRNNLQKLVDAIVARKPRALLTERGVCGYALDLLQNQGIAVAYNVSPNVIRAVARSTQSDIITTSEMLLHGLNSAEQPRVGSCEHFEIKSYVLDNMHKKTFIFMSGCPIQLACTIVLRGADLETLKQIKTLTKFMVYVVYNLKLETCLMRDEFVFMPAPAAPINQSARKSKLLIQSVADHAEEEVDETEGSNYYESLVALHGSKIVSTSPFVQIPQPYLLWKARQVERRLQLLIKAASAFDKEVQEEENIAEMSGQKAYEIIESKILMHLPGGDKQTIRQVRRAILELEHDKLEYVSTIQKRQWEAYLAQTTSYLFNPSAYQHITILYSLICEVTTAPCTGPELVSIEYYRDGDCTLGQFVEGICANADQWCSDGCSYSLARHYRSYVHGNGCVNVRVSKLPCRIPGMDNTILMWSHCNICDTTLPALPMSENTWKYSFGKYLELSFWSSPLSLRAEVCPHDIHKDHVRVFGLHGLCVQFEYTKIELLDIAFPRLKLLWKPEIDVHLRAAEYTAIEEKITKFFDSVGTRLDSVRVEEFSSLDRTEDCKVRVNAMKERAAREVVDLKEMLETIYTETSYRDYLTLNAVIRSLQECVVQWDMEFADFDRSFYPSEKDIARLTAMQLKKMFLERDTSAVTLIPDDQVEYTPTSTDLSSAVELMPVLGDRDGTSTADSTPLNSANSSTVPSEYGVQSPDYLSSVFLSPGLPALSARGEMPSAKRLSATSSQRKGDVILVSDTENKVSPTSLVEPLTAMDAKKEDASEKIAPEKLTTESLSTNDDDMSDTSTLDSVTISEADSVISSGPKSVTVTNMSSRPSIRKYPPERIIVPPAPTFRHRFTQGTTQELARQLQLSRSGANATGLTQSEAGTETTANATTPGANKVVSLARHFDQLSREFEKERARERKKLTQGRLRSIGTAKPIVEVYRTIEDAVVEEDDGESGLDYGIETSSVLSPPETKATEATSYFTIGRAVSDAMKSAINYEGNFVPLNESSATLVEIQPKDSATDSRHANHGKGGANEAEQNTAEQSQMPSTPAAFSSEHTFHSELTPGPEKVSLMTMLSNFWADRSASGWKPLAYPLQPSEHIFMDSDVIVREDEPSSLIAFCLSSADYREKLHQIRMAEDDVSSSGDDPRSREDLHRWLEKATGTHLKYQFQEGHAKLSCKIFYAELFDAFRTLCGCEETYIQSLSRCVKWDSTGGKSGSAFLKTLDDRLVVKQLSPSELDAFIKFAPSYLRHMGAVFFQSLPSVIAKILGFYQVQVRNAVTNKTMKMDIIVMENLLYDRKLTRIFDLKGSMRNRHVEQTGRANEVLLDENMVEYIFESPLYVREHAKNHLRTSLFNDTLFLGQMNVMDYSLVIAIDSERQQLVVGIIDCLRTFTWDKKLESWVKERGLVGGGGKVPTVVTPKQYKNRFREAMERYILMVPEYVLYKV
ncbi:hypothetical protein V1512DRAFT_203844 [Lipomyces arxii]|uniref:uncharacterized protein n=1 Tax=Lipomyces arxii TaxID=56418 RepID=UPI0034CF5A6B